MILREKARNIKTSQAARETLKSAALEIIVTLYALYIDQLRIKKWQKTKLIHELVGCPMLGNIIIGFQRK